MLKVYKYKHFFVVLSREQFCGESRLTNMRFLTLVSAVIVFWNVENLFEANGGKASLEAQKIGRTLLYIGENSGGPPDIVGLAEIDGEAVVRKIARCDALKDLGYGYIHYDSPDPRGIDVACLYRRSRFRPVESKAIRVPWFSTRDLLKVRFVRVDGAEAGAGNCAHDGNRDSDGDTLTVFVCHFPSKLGGQKVSGPKRDSVVALLKRSLDSTAVRTVIMGDMNSGPDDSCFGPLELAGMVNMGLGIIKGAAESTLKGHAKGTAKATTDDRAEGTYKYKGQWELIDNFLLSPDLAESSVMKVGMIPFLLEPDREYGGMKPFRTYVGPRYNGGISDHLPIILQLEDNKPDK